MKIWFVHRCSFEGNICCSNFWRRFHWWHDSTCTPISKLKLVLSIKKRWSINCKRFFLEKLRKTFHWSLVLLGLNVINFFELILNLLLKNTWYVVDNGSLDYEKFLLLSKKPFFMSTEEFWDSYCFLLGNSVLYRLGTILVGNFNEWSFGLWRSFA